jgi:hypothetical protein
LKRELENDKFIRVTYDRKDIHEFPLDENFNPRQLN